MKHIIHVNQAIIKANTKNGTDDPPLTIKNYKETRNAHTVDILDSRGNVVARVINSPHKPLKCGARVWIETYSDVEVDPVSADAAS